MFECPLAETETYEPYEIPIRSTPKVMLYPAGTSTSATQKYVPLARDTLLVYLPLQRAIQHRVQMNFGIENNTAQTTLLEGWREVRAEGTI